MKTIKFPYFVSFGKLDSVSCEIELSISDKDAKRLEKSAKEGGKFRLNEDEDLSDLYDKVYQKIILKEKDALLSDPSQVKDFLSWEDGYSEDLPITEEQIDYYLDSLAIGINYPEDLQLLEKSVVKKKKQTKCESVTIDRSKAHEYIYEDGNKDKVVYVDGGETLYYVPSKYTGSFTIPSSVKRLEPGSVFNPFRKRNKITEIIIEEGLTEIPEWAFDGCDSLERIVIPGSVKKIDYNAFTKCRHLKKVELSEGLTEIHNTAFRYCSDLEQLQIPASVVTVSMHITSYDSGIKSLIFEGMATTIDDTMCRGDEWEKVTVYAKEGSVAKSFAKEHGIKVEAIR